MAAPVGIKYHRITGHTSNKELYDPTLATRKAAEHAGMFLAWRKAQIEHLGSSSDHTPIIVAPFDAELFGHWWFEGPAWLDYVIRKTAFDQNTVTLATLSEYLDQHPVQQIGQPATSTWGNGSNLDIWLNGKLDWMYSDLLNCGARMGGLLRRHEAGEIGAGAERAMNQSLRELLLAQSSDWPFIVSNETTAQYAARRFKDHICRFDYLADAIDSGQIDEEPLQILEYVDSIFPNLDYRSLCSDQNQAEA